MSLSRFSLRSSWMLVATFVAVGSVSLTLSGQAPAPAPQGAPADAGRQGGPAGPGGPGAPGAPGRGGAPGGRGNQGGPQAADLANAGVDFSKRDPVLPKSPEEQAKFFILQQGFSMTPILADPILNEPTAVSFDGNGRMFVLQDVGYMKDADATGEREPVGKISRHEDRDNDGVYETHTVFVDKLVFPRFALPWGADAVITMETDADDVFKYTDTNGDGVADKKELFASNFGRSGNVEHQQAFLHWGMDNWLYSSVNAFRVRWTPNGLLRESTGSNGAQWGVTHDNDGKVWFQGGASGVPAYFQFPIHYGTINFPEQFETDFRIPWGAPVRVADMQGGMPSVRMPDGSLNGVTGSAGNDIFRGHRMPADMQGDLFYGEPVARIVRRIKPVNVEGMTQLRNAYYHDEFIKSTDPLFRPVDMTTAPDGTLYITDMYRGIIQEAQWAGRGTYLRARIEQYDLDKRHSLGRIWRLTHNSMERDRTQPRMLNETPAQLVAHLSHANGWWRDTAQQLLVLKQDKSVVPALQQIVRSSDNVLARFHAMWTLEGLGALDATTVRSLMKDTNPRVRVQAIRASETLYKAGDRSFLADYRTASRDSDTNVAIQGLLTLKLFNPTDLKDVVTAAQGANKARGVQIVGQAALAPPVAFGGGGRGAPTYTNDQIATLQAGQTIYNELCFTCHGSDGLGATSEAGTLRAPALAASPRVNAHRDYVVKTLLHGMTGPIDGTTYVEVMVPMGSNRDEWIASVGSYIRNSFGNLGDFITPADVARVRTTTRARRTMWSSTELSSTLPRLLAADPATWKVTASHNSATAATAFGFGNWTTGAPQEAGMWFQVELPQPVMVTEISFESGGAGRGGGGGGGRGAAPAGAPGAPGAPAPGAAPAAPAAGAPPAGAPAAGPGGPQAGGGRGNVPAGPAVIGYPRGYKVEVSINGTTWGQPVAQGQGTGSPTVISFAPVRAKFVRITQTATTPGAPIWSIQRMRIFEVPAAQAAAR